MLLKNYSKREEGNISVLILLLILIISFLIIFIFDICRIFIAREVTKSAADSAALACAQDLLFFNQEYCKNVAEKIALKNNCTLSSLEYSYSEVVVEMDKRVDFIFTGNIFKNHINVKSKSKARIIYPWDEEFGYCKRYMFAY